MADRNRKAVRIRTLQPSMAYPHGQVEAEMPMLNGVDNHPPQLAESGPPSQTVQPSRASRRVCPSCTVEVDEDVNPLEDEESDSDSSSEWNLMEQEELQEFNFEIDDYEGAVGVAEGQQQNHHAPASTPAGQTDFDGGLGSSSAVAAALNNPNGAIPVVFTDPDVLDCPICLEPLCPPIYQCENGHIACPHCCRKSKHKCPSCCLPIGSNRCRAMEKLIDSVKVDCENKAYGCTEPLIYHMKAQHEQVCKHTLCLCPLSSCNFDGSSENLYAHFSTHHSSSATAFTFDSTFHLDVRRDQKHVILQERNTGVIFILNHGVHAHGRVLNVDCLGSNSFRSGFVYKLSVRCSETCFAVESVPEVCAKWEEHTPNKNYLTIPSGYLQFIVEVCIKKAYPVV